MCSRSVHTKKGEGGQNSADLGERVGGELGDGEEPLSAAVELAEALVQRHDLLLRDLDSIRSILGGRKTLRRVRNRPIHHQIEAKIDGAGGN